MNLWIMMSGLLLGGSTDQGAKLVAEVLQPREKREAKIPGPKGWPAAGLVENPGLPILPYAGGLPRTDLPIPGRVVRPRHPTEETPLAGYRGQPVPPPVPEMAVAPLVRLAAVDVNEVPPLPILAKPVPDRASLADPTMEASTAAAVANAIPVRISPAPFVRLNLPDPFEHHHAVRVRTPPAEDIVPPVVIPRTPAR